jgi:hypothetical protein
MAGCCGHAARLRPRSGFHNGRSAGGRRTPQLRWPDRVSPQARPALGWRPWRRRGYARSIDGFRLLPKRGLMATLHNVSAQSLPLHMAEFEWRSNKRDNPEMVRDAVARCRCTRIGGCFSLSSTGTSA